MKQGRLFAFAKQAPLRYLWGLVPLFLINRWFFPFGGHRAFANEDFTLNNSAFVHSTLFGGYMSANYGVVFQSQAAGYLNIVPIFPL